MMNAETQRRRDQTAEREIYFYSFSAFLSLRLRVSASLRSFVLYDFFDAKSFMNWDSAWQPSTGIAL
jgi:hypothetical protein